MSHEFNSGYFVGNAAWHRLGKVFAEAITDPAEIMTEAGWDYPIGVVTTGFPDQTVTVDGQEYQLDGAADGYRACVNLNTGKVYGKVTERYQALQNQTVLDKVIMPLVESGAAELVTCGTLADGQRLFATLRIVDVDPIEVVKGDAVVPFLCISFGHGGTVSFTICFCPFRFVCANTVRAGIDQAKSKGKLISLKHTPSIVDGIDAAMSVIDVAKRDFHLSADTWTAMAKKSISGRELKDYLFTIFDADGKYRAKGKQPKAVGEIELLSQDSSRFLGSDIPGVNGTVWGAYNAVSQWAGTDGGARTVDKAVEKEFFGSGGLVLDRAHDAALALC